jgi:nicotinate-nucleotide adenylyltransferase
VSNDPGAGRKVGVLGGTFDPVHIGHLLLAESAREELGLERVVFMPAGRPWRKASREVSPAEHRLAMLRLAVAGNDAFEVSTIEVEREGPTYTVETLEELRRRDPGAALFFIVGEDALADLPNWREPQRILQLATVAVAGRTAEGPNLRQAEAMMPGLVARAVWLRMPIIEISATGIRERVRLGLSIRYRVPAAVEAYIREHRLYVRAG